MPSAINNQVPVIVDIVRAVVSITIVDQSLIFILIVGVPVFVIVPITRTCIFLPALK